MKITVLALMFSLLATAMLSAQESAVIAYRAKIITRSGLHLEGMVQEVTDSQLLYSDTRHPSSTLTGYPAVLLLSIKKVMIYRDNRRVETIKGARIGGNDRRSAIIKGALIGGAGLGFLTFRSLETSPPRSPLFFGFTLAVGAGAGAIIGGATGAGIKSLLPGRDSYADNDDDDVERLRIQLTPYSYQYQVNQVEILPRRMN